MTLRNADFVGVMEDTGRLVRLLQCVLGVPGLNPPSDEVRAAGGRTVGATNRSQL